MARLPRLELVDLPQHVALGKSETYLLRCYRYIELNPVRAAMVSQPSEYRWSSFGCNALGIAYPLVQPHPSCLALGATAKTRHKHCRQLFREALNCEELETIRLHLQRQHALGTERFRSHVESMLGQRVGPARIGRPRKRESAL